MKTLARIFFLMALISLVAGCAKSDDFPEEDALGMKKAVEKGDVFIVEPTGDDDTPAILQAFTDAIAAGPGSVVQLLEGDYSLGFMEVRDFCGSFVGAGKEKTIITVMNNLDGQSKWDQGVHTDLVKFVGGDIFMGHFTIQTPPGKLCTTGPKAGHIRTMFNFSTNSAIYEAGNEDRYINVEIDNACFKSQFIDEAPGTNCYYSVRAGWDWYSGSDLAREKIDFKITRSTFDTFRYGLVLEGLKNGNIIVGEKKRGNLFNNTRQCGGVWESRNMNVTIEGNTMNVPPYGWGFNLCNYPYYSRVLKAEPQTSATICNVSDNVFNLDHAETGIYYQDVRLITHPGEMPVICQLKNNLFTMKDGYEWAIINLISKGMVIRNNKFSGHGDLGVYNVNHYGYGVYNEDGLMLGNNFSTAVLNSGAVYLSKDTRNWTIVGGNIKEQVIDRGIDNIITGMNVSTSETPLGYSVSAKLSKINQLMK